MYAAGCAGEQLNYSLVSQRAPILLHIQERKTVMSGFKHICTPGTSPIKRRCLHALPLDLEGLSICLEK